MAVLDLTFEKGLPCATEEEKLLLGLAQSDYAQYWEKIEGLPVDAFTTEACRKIFGRMQDIAARGEPFDRVVVASELIKWGQLDVVGGLSFLVSLDDAVPPSPHIEQYIKRVMDKYHARKLIFAAQKIIDANLIGEQAPEATLAAFEEVTRDLGEKTRDNGRTPVQIVREHQGGIEGFLNPAAGPRGVMTGFTSWDEATGGLFGDQLIILGARPAMGKTAWAVSVLDHVTQSMPAVKFSLEMGGSSIIRRLICSNARVNLHRFRNGQLGDDDRSRLQVALSEVADRPLKIYDNPSMTINAICKAARQEVEREGCKLIVIDHLGLISTKGMKFDRKDLEIGHITRSLKMLTKQLQVPIIALCQLSRDSSKTRGARPELHDLRNSGDIEQDADIAAFLYREEYYHREREDLRGRAELIIRKQRDGGVGTCHLQFTREYARFDNPPEDQRGFSEH